METMLTDELLHLREGYRIAKNWKASDELRDELRLRNVIVTDTAQGQEAVHLPPHITVDAYMERQAQDKRAEARFEAWLFSMQQSFQ